MREHKDHRTEAEPDEQERLSRRYEREDKHQESRPEKTPERREERIEEARKALERESTSFEKPSRPETEENFTITKLDKQRTYKTTLSRLQSRLTKPSRTFSRAIHTPVVENASELLEKTLVRPSGLLGGSLAATLGLALMLYFARRHGFALSGSEFLLLLAAGWIFGLAIEFTVRLWRRYRSSFWRS